MRQPARNVTYAHCPNAEARSEYLVSIAPLGAVLDCDADARAAQARFGRLFSFLEPDGQYLLDCLCGRDCHAELAHALDGSHGATAQPELSETRECVRSVRQADRFVVIGKGVRHRIGLRDHRTNAILRARYGDGWGAVVHTVAPTQFRPRVEVTEFGDRSEWWEGSAHTRATTDRVSVPELTLRRYADVTCWSEQRVAKDGLWLPDTFRHPYGRVLHHRRLVRNSGWTLRIRDGAPEIPSREVSAPCFYFDTEHAGHFGHVLSEVVSRHWGWVRAKEGEPDLRALVSRPRPGAELPRFQQRLFAALGIDDDMIEYIEPSEAVAVRCLYAATPMFSMPAYVSPEIARTWQLLAARLNCTQLRTPQKLFVSRRPRQRRTCLNTEQVEDFVRGRGYTVFFPEDHDLAEQLTTFRNADIIAGFAGSNMFPMIGARQKNVVAIAGRSYGACNEFLIAAVNGGKLTHVVADSAVQHPPGGWSPVAYQSNFTVPMDRLAAALDHAEAAVTTRPARTARTAALSAR
jgi:capsular polysaccharide biosynthesis protein